MPSPLRKLDTLPKVECFRVARGLAWAYTGLFLAILLLVVAFRLPTGLLLVPGILCLLFWGNLAWMLVSLPSPAGRCPKCDYPLFGLAEARCPECGRPFDFEEVRSTPEELWFGEDSWAIDHPEQARRTRRG